MIKLASSSFYRAVWSVIAIPVNPRFIAIFMISFGSNMPSYEYFEWMCSSYFILSHKFPQCFV